MSMRGNLISFFAVLACAVLASVVTALVVLGAPSYAVTPQLPDPRLEGVLQHITVDNEGNVTIRGMNVTIKAENSSNMESGLNGRISAGASLIVTSVNNATFEAANTATIKAAAVRINSATPVIMPR